ncbi:carbohydrate ABC transporter permease [Vibrio sp. S9_S30]|uniref:carbohydrate ABC transporter permease n=1 Tax=Vibrio sp. S9_S30 TaxID=2720226 RepID=UPI001680EC0E|nr:carbohydrate ABC transporter permease [Vibrio sp. S9_S30]MBD1556635.1 carbohydrate ABC transporter permease [Vibrio sp. S9_S30]
MATNRYLVNKPLHRLAIAAVMVLLIASLIPLYWIISTGFKARTDATSVPPTVFFEPQITAYAKNFTKRVQLREPATQEMLDDASWWEKAILDDGERVVKSRQGEVRSSGYTERFMNSIIIAGASTFLAVSLGTLCAYGFSRFCVKGEKDWLFFILSTRMLPPIVVAIPVFLMFRTVGLIDTHLGLTLLYTAFNVSFATWLMKGFIDEIPREYEEAALVDGYPRIQVFFRITLPECATGIAATSVFCFITAWNEYAFAMMLTNRTAQTAPAFIPSQLGSGLIDWSTIAAGTTLFLIPVFVFTFLLRKHLLRGVTFGAIRR